MFTRLLFPILILGFGAPSFSLGEEPKNKSDEATRAIEQGNKLLNSKSYEDAIKHFDRAIRFDPISQAYEGRGVAKFWLGDADGAIADYDAAIALEPKRAAIYYNRGLAWMKKSNLGRAEADLDIAIRLDPRDPDLFSERGQVRMIQKEWDKAKADFDEAIRLSVDHAPTYFRRGNLYAIQGKLDDAIADLGVVIRLNPQLSDSFLNRGTFHLRRAQLAERKGAHDVETREHEAALADFNRASELSPRSSEAFTNIAVVWTIKGEYEKALTNLSNAIKLNPSSKSALKNRVTLLASCPDGKYRDGKLAIVDGLQLCQLSQWRDADSIFRLATAYAEVGEFDEATKWLQKAMTEVGFANEHDRAQALNCLKLFQMKQPFRASPPAK